ncbi:MAG: type 4a pilus biogenesis protein PilO [Candidatus Paceibacterota bacterium]|jgi:Tfp pilus assembly protein PilO
MKNITPFILIVAAIWIFWGYTKPIYEETGALRGVRTGYENKLAQANEFRQQYENLATAYQSFSETDLANLSHLVPDEIDPIRLVIEVNEIAAKQGLLIEDIAVSESGNTAKEANLPAVETSFNSVFSNVDLSFSVTGSYGQFVAFLHDLESSLRILDVTDIKFSLAKDSVNGGSYNFSVGLKTYWLQ